MASNDHDEPPGRILVVDDDLVTGRFLANLLRRPRRIRRVAHDRSGCRAEAGHLGDLRIWSSPMWKCPA